MPRYSITDINNICNFHVTVRQKRREGKYMQELNVVITLAGALSALLAIIGMIFAVYRWYLKQEAQDSDIKKIKEENALIVYALSACLEGLIQLGADEKVKCAKDKLDKYINTQAHR